MRAIRLIAAGLAAFAFAALLVPVVALAQTPFVIPLDVKMKNPSNIRPAPVYVNARALAANVAETTVLPAGTRFVIFSADCNFYAKPGASAAVASDVTDGTASELNPAAWYFSNPAASTQQITVIAPTACNVTFSAYQGPLQ